MIKEKFDLSGKNALVVGGRGFLGRRFCAALA
jgi:NAD(P)-dependent dehydrogenase (short-subunit alcohol dehydrogenase family)